ncbi:MAG: HlyD family secretion protein [Ewingella americana]|jgi:membrane fusion protein|uniref:HlyD family secretion protein n=1 Tax=Ewingella americana TaxID=41202 RepID=UPI00242DD51D|nr:HlyD family secretion protein [Ewingella americana]MCI1679124.1 HlyD family secretion protein [Ewingella americana]MCI1852232.1 HlyD family secretion protein [Ewingella americana]MCI1862634.1 HlyD family secretion protein [Ewingella americana]MCI2142936.1 HlyD family secretion protein [Ewingella americana]MCI2163428.1 HlyD family secretion protein [Ewingella americana]
MLFRKEVNEHQQNHWAGKALLLAGWPVWVVTSLTALFLIALLSFLIFSNYTRRINVSGEVITQPHSINLFSPEQGVVTHLMVETGKTVKKGQPLYQIDVSRVTQAGNVSTTTLSAINKQRDQIDTIITQLQNNKRTTLDNLQQQLEQYEKAHKVSQDMVASAQQGLDAMKQSMQNYGAYQRKGLINTDQLNNQRYLFYQQQTSFQSLNTQSIQESLQITNLRSELVTRAADFDNQISQYGVQRNDLDRQLAEADAKGSLLITAPTDGKISSLSVTPGQMVNAGDSLAQLVPAKNSPFFLVAWLPNESVPYVKPGEEINIRYEAYPFEKYGQFPGRVESVSSAPVSEQELNSYSSAPKNPNGTVSGPYYKVIVSLDKSQLNWHGETLNLSSGMKAESTMFLEKRPLYQWMLSPYYSMKKSVVGPINESR